MTKKKKRNQISPELAAEVLFLSDRTCCVCRIPGKPIQIHHIDEDPSNNSPKNLAVLCFDCHRETQIRGGFDRKLDAEQVALYRDDWNQIVSINRFMLERHATHVIARNEKLLDLATSLAEIFRENKEYGVLATHYHYMGNKELRDKYIELSLEANPSDFDVINLRSLQGKPELIPDQVINREFKRYTENKDWSQRARFHLMVGRRMDAAMDYIETVRESLQENNFFAAAYYLKEMVNEGLA